jgi:FkbM family methyltransferase
MRNGVVSATGRWRRRLAYGTRQAGITRTIAGLARLGALAIRRPDYGQIRTSRDQLSISFRYPSQLIPTLVVFGDLLEPELGFLPAILGPGAVAVDVGASIGTWALSAARTGATVHACEPDPVNLEALEANIRANRLPGRVRTYDMALGAQPGTGSMVAAGRRYLNRVRETSGDAGRDFPVATLDQFADEQRLDEIDVLKVNTAGGERAVLRGAAGLFRARRVRLAMILDGLEVRPLLDDLRAYRYDIGVYDGNLGRFVSVSHSRELDAARPSPMNRYALVRRDDVSLC